MPMLTHKILYVRALLALLFQSFAIYLDLFLMVAVGICTDRKELLIRDLDEYGVKRSKGFAIYDITKTNKPYYASLKESAAEDEKSMQDRYMVVKEGEENGPNRKVPDRSIAGHDANKID